MYEPLWSKLFDPAWNRDSWTHDRSDRPALGDVTPDWRMTTPLRTDRRQALLEIDAITAIMLGITAAELCAIYRTRFGVLRKYERVMRFDANSRQVPSDIVKPTTKTRAKPTSGTTSLPFIPVDREKDMTRAHEVFTERLRSR